MNKEQGTSPRWMPMAELKPSSFLVQYSMFKIPSISLMIESAIVSSEFGMTTDLVIEKYYVVCVG